MTPCCVCGKALNPRTDVRLTMDNRTFCSGLCIFRYRGKLRIY